MGLPSLTSMWAVYPTGTSASVKSKIGGGAGMGWVTNTCVIRISYCFNKCGEPIPNGQPGLSTTYGADGKRYAFRVTEFKTYLENRYKPADVSGGGRDAVSGQQGIIMFDVEGWSDATGHFDLWNGSECRGAEYFDKASAVYLWTCG